MIREAILAELERQGRTRYSLAHSQDSAHPSTCLAFLYGGRNISLVTAEAMLVELGLALVPAAELDGLRELVKAVTALRRRPGKLGKILAGINESPAEAKGA